MGQHWLISDHGLAKCDSWYQAPWDNGNCQRTPAVPVTLIREVTANPTVCYFFYGGMKAVPIFHIKICCYQAWLPVLWLEAQQRLLFLTRILTFCDGCHRPSLALFCQFLSAWDWLFYLDRRSGGCLWQVHGEGFTETLFSPAQKPADFVTPWSAYGLGSQVCCSHTIWAFTCTGHTTRRTLTGICCDIKRLKMLPAPQGLPGFPAYYSPRVLSKPWSPTHLDRDKRSSCPAFGKGKPKHVRRACLAPLAPAAFRQPEKALSFLQLHLPAGITCSALHHLYSGSSESS